jgi:enoyl-CoA hydratase/carnithine racemase
MSAVTDRPTVRLATRAGFDTVELDSPHNRNALSVDLLRRLHTAIDASAASTSRGLLLSHAGPSFCSGVDLRERRELPPSDTTHSRMLTEVLRQLWHYPKPVVALVDGSVRGGGLGLLAGADVVLATPASTFAYSEVRVGVAPALVMAVTLPLVDSRRLLPHLLDGQPFDAEAARELGLVTSIVPSRANAAVETVLDGLRRGAPGALATVKRLARTWADTDMDGLLEEMGEVSADLFASAEAAEGMAAFAERRPPSWAQPDPDDLARGEEAVS